MTIRLVDVTADLHQQHAQASSHTTLRVECQDEHASRWEWQIFQHLYRQAHGTGDGLQPDAYPAAETLLDGLPTALIRQGESGG